MLSDNSTKRAKKEDFDYYRWFVLCKDCWENPLKNPVVNGNDGNEIQEGEEGGSKDEEKGKGGNTQDEEGQGKVECSAASSSEEEFETGVEFDTV